jgi:hypothetical protein
MKAKLLVLFYLFISSVFAQELILNPETKIYEYSEIKETTLSNSDFIKQFDAKMKELSYSDIQISESSISGKNFISFLILTTPVQIHYQVSIEIKDSRYKILFNRFVADDKRYSPIPIEDLKSYTKKWVKKINEKLPTIVNAIQSPVKEW